VEAVAKAVLAAHADGSLPAPDSDDFDAAWKKWVKAVGKDLGRKGKDLFMPLRIVTTGRMAGPDIPAQLKVLGLASGTVEADVVALDSRMAALEAAVGAAV